MIKDGTYFHLHRPDAPDEDHQTVGELRVYVNHRHVFTCRTVERPWEDNKTGVSCIPLGVYPIKHFTSPTFGKIIAVNDVKGRDLIRIHAANYMRQLRGCIAPGAAFTDLDGDGYRDVTNSRATMEKLLALLPKAGAELLITADANWN